LKLTEKDAEFLDKLKHLMETRDLWVDLRIDRPSHMVLRGTYGEKISRYFRMTRQGVRWRFQRVFNDMYISAFLTILFIEKNFGSHLREHAVRISKERFAMRQEMSHIGFRSTDSICSRKHDEGQDWEIGKPQPRPSPAVLK